MRAERQASYQERFWSRVDMRGKDKCWEWQGSKNKTGHGKWRLPSGRDTSAHRIAYKLYKGEIGNGLVIAHSCDNPSCCNPAHLSAVSQSANMQDMVSKGRHAKQRKFGKKTKKRVESDTPRRLGLPKSLEGKGGGPIINLCGPPGAGKTTLCEGYLQRTKDNVDSEHAGVLYCNVDEYRSRLYDNRLVWDSIVADASGHSGAVLVESSGLSVSLQDLERIAKRQGRPFRTVIVSAPRDVCMSRLAGRLDTMIEGAPFTVTDMVDDCIRKLPFVYSNKSITINTAKSLEECEQAFTAVLDSALYVGKHATMQNLHG